MYINKVDPNFAIDKVEKIMDEFAKGIKSAPDVMRLMPQYLYISTTFRKYAVRYNQKVVSNKPGEIKIYPLQFSLNGFTVDDPKNPKTFILDSDEKPKDLTAVMDIITNHVEQQLYNSLSDIGKDGIEHEIQGFCDAARRITIASLEVDYMPYIAMDIF